MNRLEARIAVVTGGGSGIGAAICRRFAEEGARVIVTDLALKSAEAVHSDCERSTAGGAALELDVTKPESVHTSFQEIKNRFGRLDVLVNNAGIGVHGPRSEKYIAVMVQQVMELTTTGSIRTHCDATMDLSDEEWDRMIRTHLYGTFTCNREALRIMAGQTGELSAGKIINMASIMGTAGGAGAVDYCAAKAGILGLTRALARETATRKIQVNAIAPGFIDTPLIDSLKPVHDLIRTSTPQGRIGHPDDVAWAAVYLASSESDFMTGQVISPNGGWYMSQ